MNGVAFVWIGVEDASKECICLMIEYVCMIDYDICEYRSNTDVYAHLELWGLLVHDVYEQLEELTKKEVNGNLLIMGD